MHYCPCGSNLFFSDCCEKIHSDQALAQTAEALMRSRYSAFVVANIQYLYNSFHPSSRRYQSKRAISQWATENKWEHLEIIKSTTETVEFKAYYLDTDGIKRTHHEKSNFKKLHQIWYYLDGKLIP